MEKRFFQIQPNLLEINWPQEISDEILQDQLMYKNHLEQHYGDCVLEIRIGFNSLSVLFDQDIKKEQWSIIWNELENLKTDVQHFEPKIFKIPVCYQGEYGIDLENLAKSKKLSASELIELHSSKKYRLFFYGFLPGFMYLGGLDPKLHSPRKSTPDLMIPKGSVAIGGRQTGIYPMDSPGGWHVVGRTPLTLFDPQKPIPTIAQQGDFIQFHQIDQDEFKSISNQLLTGKYELEYA
ncbi:5-oxoprolinase subunit PxpB [Belliella sp. R4-6]|uniref:5-oxoprolinase subunit PxpB n=1 Tax=Belliella alkalica TaxID=1730871 RepID=A0ABS9VBP0_9BACT|nr:5-oxoprolinase subunit PxpB [Belliella alkalica]MCH7413857.1 5-oxoprolinase subunit PxpB [Belliella alkalica]